MATIEEELPVLGIKVSGHYIRHIAVIYCYGTSVARSPKLLALPYPFLKKQQQLSYYLRTVAT